MPLTSYTFGIYGLYIFIYTVSGFWRVGNFVTMELTMLSLLHTHVVLTRHAILNETNNFEAWIVKLDKFSMIALQALKNY